MNVNTVKAAQDMATELLQRLTQISSEMERDAESRLTITELHSCVFHATLNLTKVRDSLKRIEQLCGKRPIDEQ